MAENRRSGAPAPSPRRRPCSSSVHPPVIQAGARKARRFAVKATASAIAGRGNDAAGVDRRVDPGLGGCGARLGFGARDRAVLHHPDRLRGRGAMRLVLQPRGRAGTDRERFPSVGGLSARASAGHESAAGQSVDAGASRSEQRLRRDRRGPVQPGRRRTPVARLFAEPDHRQGRRHRPRDLQGDRKPRRGSEFRSTSSRPGTCRRSGCRATSPIAAATPM